MEGKSSLIFMRDDGKTLRWRMGPTTLRVVVALLVLLPLMTAGSLWLNWKLFQDRRSVLAENAELRGRVETNAQTVARLSGLERYLRQSAPSSLSQLAREGDAMPDTPREETPASRTDAVPFEVASPAPPSDSPQAMASRRPDASLDVVAPVVTNTAAAPDEEPDGQSLAENQADANAPDNSTDVPSPDARTDTPTQTALEPVDTGLARVERLQARRVGPRSLRISFDLYNSQQVPQLAGRAAFQLVLADGRVFQLDAHGDTTYRINRLKKIVGNPTLPAEVTETDGAVIVVSVYADENVIYRTTTPLQP